MFMYSVNYIDAGGMPDSSNIVAESAEMAMEFVKARQKRWKLKRIVDVSPGIRVNYIISTEACTR